MIPITRIGKSRLSNTRSGSIVHQGVLTIVAVAPETPPNLYMQSKDALAVLDQNLAEAGTDKSRVLMVMIDLQDVDTKPEFNRAWDDWVERDNLPLRACSTTPLAGRRHTTHARYRARSDRTRDREVRWKCSKSGGVVGHFGANDLSQKGGMGRNGQRLS